MCQEFQIDFDANNVQQFVKLYKILNAVDTKAQPPAIKLLQI